MCPPLAANCQVTGEFPVLIMPNLVLRVPCLSVCHKVCDYELLMLTESEAKLLMVPTCSKVTLETKKKKNYHVASVMAYIYGIPFKKKLQILKKSVFELSYKFHYNSGCDAKKQMTAVQNEL